MVLPHIVKKALLRIDVLYFWMHLCYMKFIDHSFYSSSLKIKIVILSLTGQYIECMVDLDTAKSVKECKIIMSLTYVVKKTLSSYWCAVLIAKTQWRRVKSSCYFLMWQKDFLLVLMYCTYRSICLHISFS